MELTIQRLQNNSPESDWIGLGRAGVTWLLAIQAHKQAKAMLKALLQPLDQAWIIPVPGHRSWDVNALLQINPDWHSQLHQGRRR